MWWSTVILTIPDPPAALRDRLAAALNAKPPAFHGDTDNAGFTVTRRHVPFGFRNSFPVYARGRFEPVAGEGTRVVIRFRPRVLAWVMMAVVVGAFADLRQRPHEGDWFAPWFATGAIVFVAFVAAVAGTIEADLIRTRLSQVLKPHPSA